jgi:pimeloyl-ACP methyl ester carboxylesterase
VVVHSVRISIGLFSFLVSMLVALCQITPIRAALASGTSVGPPVIVIGFVGGFIRHNDLVHGGVQLAARLRKEYPAGVYAEAYENRRAEQAHEDILKLLDTNHDGKLSNEEKQRARIIIYGHSWGGSETVNLARELQHDGIPVLLTIQVDSVAKLGEDDSLIPANVAEAANFYQSGGLVRGRAAIRAADPKRTQIIGNYRFDYNANPIHCVGYPWYAIAFEYSHIEIECDPAVMNHVESLIRSKLP